MVFHTSFRRDFTRLVPAAVLLIMAAGCSALPASGPTGAEVRNGIRNSQPGEAIKLVELEGVADLPAPPAPGSAIFVEHHRAVPPTNLVGPGDVLDIAIYETGITLFGGTSNPTAAVATGFSPAAKAERLPPNRVDDAGVIRVPYIGALRVSGRTTTQIEAMILKGLQGMSQNPQVVVSIREGLTNSVIIGGDVARAGRLVLPTNRETLSDAIALAGGQRGEIKDLVVRVQRDDRSAEYRLSDIVSGPERDFRVHPGDRITIVRSPRSFSVMGAPGRVEQIPFSSPSVSLAEAVAQAGGANPNQGDPKAIFVFRLVPGADGVSVPVVYHLNMLRTQSYFLSQRFAMLDKDILYIGNAASNQPSKLIQIVGQLFSPVLMMQAATNNN